MAGLKINEDEESFEIPETVTTRLKCGNCGHVGRYNVGRICVNPDAMKRDDEDFSNYVAFSGYFRCRRCKSAGPWEFTPEARMAVMAAMILKSTNFDDGRLIFAIPALFDGTPCKSAAYGEDYLKSILDKDPDNAFVWSRLGNIYRSAGLNPKAVKAYKKAIQLNPDDIESHYGLGTVLFHQNKLKESANHLHQVLKLAHANNQLSKEHLRDCVSDTLNTIIKISDRTDNEIPLLGNFDFRKIEATSDKPIVLTTRNFDLSCEDDWESLIDMITGESTCNTPDVPSQTEQKKVSRNSPCPCGSGKKYKKCCG